MATLKEINSGETDVVRIAMKIGKLVIDSSQTEWINPTTKKTIPGIALVMSEDAGGAPLGYAELNLAKKADQEVYKRFKEWIAEDSDERIHELGVREMVVGEYRRPFPWWDTTAADTLLNQVIDGVESLPNIGERKLLVEQCVGYEKQNKARKVLVNKLMDIDLDVTAVGDELDPK